MRKADTVDVQVRPHAGRRAVRRAAGALLALIGVLLLWLAPSDSGYGVVLLLSGIAIECVGLLIEHYARTPAKERDAAER